MLCWGNLDVGTALIDRYPDTRFIIDHLGIMQPRVPPAPPQPWADLPKVLDMAKRKNARDQGERRLHALEGAVSLQRHLGSAAAHLRCLGFRALPWGTDWTRAAAVVNYEQGVKPFLETERLSESERAMLMGGACAKAYRWAPKKGSAACQEPSR